MYSYMLQDKLKRDHPVSVLPGHVPEYAALMLSFHKRAAQKGNCRNISFSANLSYNYNEDS